MKRYARLPRREVACAAATAVVMSCGSYSLPALVDGVTCYSTVDGSRNSAGLTDIDED